MLLFDLVCVRHLIGLIKVESPTVTGRYGQNFWAGRARRRMSLDLGRKEEEIKGDARETSGTNQPAIEEASM